MFKDKAKKLFEKWYNEKHDDDIFFLVGEHSFNPAVEFFDIMPFNHRSGVYLQFLREQGMVITIDNFRESIDDDICFFYSIRDIREKENIATVKNWDYDTALKSAITMRDLLCNGDGAMLSFKSVVKINEWLITHGYCLDEQWIENGWVTCQK